MTTDVDMALAAEVVAAGTASGKMVVTAESCTGGMVAAALTDIAGASAVLDRGLVTYSNEAKSALLGVSGATLASHGAVSSETAAEMAAGALAAAPHSDVAVAVTGIAGPGGGSAEKPVGLVWFGLAVRDGKPETHRRHFDGDRAAIRTQAANEALRLLLGGLRP
ncbi:MAG: CinA family protein [Pseudomonadota bacterium]|nr:CinA family protein [Pseudomonadota bacterium]MEC8145294.1 CinA family protein [Pseudomonadota bacterium]